MDFPSPQPRPKVDVITVAELVRGVRRGHYRMPNFQRQLRWDADDRRLLLQSVVEGIPIGNLLLWRRPAEAGTLAMADRRIEVARRDDALWIVDGQQRVDALFGALADAHSPTEGTPSTGYRFGLDTDSGKIVSEPPAGRPSTRHLPVSKLLDPVELQMWCIARGLQNDDLRKVLAMGEAVRSYPVPQYIVETDSESDLRRIFARINSTGKRMEEFEIFEALHPGSGQSGPALEVLAKVCRDAEFGPIPRDWLLKVVEAIATTRPSRNRTRHREEAPDALSTSLKKAEPALRSTLELLRRDAGLGHVQTLTYLLPIPVLARLFAQLGEPNERTRELISRWIWRGLISGAHMGSNEHLGKALAAVRTDTPDTESAVQTLLQNTPRPEFRLDRPTRPQFKSARTHASAALAILLAKCPRDPAFPDRILTPAEIFGPFSEHQPVLLNPDAAATPANRLLVPPPEDRALLLETFAARAVADDRTFLASHGFEGSAVEALAARRDAEAFELRAEALESALGREVSRRLRMDESDRPSIAFLAGPVP